MTTQNPANTSVSDVYRLLVLSFSILIIYFAQTIVIPLTVAALLTFLLSPIVAQLEKWIGRICSILLVVASVFSILGLMGYIFARQLVSFGSNFNSYSETVQKKLQSLQFPEGKIFNRISNLFEKLKEEFFGDTHFDSAKEAAIDSKFLDLTTSFTGMLESFFGSFFNLLWMTVIIILLVIFMLLNKEDIRGRIIKLLGKNKISSATSAINEASERVFTYLFRLLIVNVGFGICVTIGLHLIGIPNAILWGCFAGLLRFIPYIGPWIAAIIPILLSFVVTDSWMTPLLTISFFIVLEMVTAYVIEPSYYGTGTGVSSFALIVAAIVWTWLWGPIGLLLSTPLTVCLVVLGQYVTNMSFLRVLLSQEQALTPAEECYHRLLSYDANDSMDVIEVYLKKNSTLSLYDSVLMPVVVQTEKDFHLDLIDIEQKENVYQSIGEILEFLNLREQKETSPSPERKGSVLCLPTEAIGDEIGISMLVQLLDLESFNVRSTSRLNISEIFELVDKGDFDAVCIGVVAPFILSKARFLCARLHQRKPQLPIVICLWGFSEVSPSILDKLSSAGAMYVVVTLSEAVYTLKEIRSKDGPKQGKMS
jgi:predicted PurR-regulated permease PerM